MFALDIRIDQVIYLKKLRCEINNLNNVGVVTILVYNKYLNIFLTLHLK